MPCPWVLSLDLRAYHTSVTQATAWGDLERVLIGLIGRQSELPSGLFRGCERDCRIISASWGATRNFELALKDDAKCCRAASAKASLYFEGEAVSLAYPKGLVKNILFRLVEAPKRLNHCFDAA
eukprot:2347609-Amphidinium_carterae.1